MNSTSSSLDSEFCGSLPLHLINLIQPHGILIILDNIDLKVIQVSENISSFLDVQPQEILDKPIADFIKPEDLKNIKLKLEKGTIKSRLSINISFNHTDKPLDLIAFITPSESYILIEIEYKVSDNSTFFDVYHEVKYLISSLTNANDLQEVAKIAAIEIKNLSGFDKVMIYKFDEDWNGTVIAEAKEEKMDSYLHLRFPASDIPKQARELYHKIPLRAIPNINFTPAKLIPIINPKSKSFTDLSECNLRSVPAVHIEYLKNMNIQASFSIPIIVNNKLWGLISFHHRTPRYLSYGLRIAFELLSSFISQRITSQEIEKESSIKSRLNDLNIQILGRILKENNFVKPLLQKSPNILDLLNISGAAISTENELRTTGDTPEIEEIEQIINNLDLMNINSVFTTSRSTGFIHDSVKNKSRASGIIVIPVSQKNREYIIGFRQEVIQNIKWGGNPYEAINFEPNGKDYHPRNSFKVYKETVKGCSDPWLPQEIKAAEELRTAILEQIIKEKT